MTAHQLLIDASGYAYRAYATASPVHRGSDGAPIGATLRFFEMLWRLLGEAQADKPSHAAAVFDHRGKNFRHRLFPDYKANRPAARNEELDDQFPFMKHVAETLGMTAVQAPGEADDAIATLAAQAMAASMRTTIVSSDKDFAQCVVDGWIEVYDPLARRRFLAADIEEKYGVPPHQMRALQALAGDTVDNIPGIKGMGMKSAAGLVRRFGGVDAVLKNAQKVRQPSLRRELLKPASAKLARLCLKLVTLKQDVALPVVPSDLLLAPIMHSHIKEILRSLEAPKWAEATLGLDPQVARVVPHVDDPGAWWHDALNFPGIQGVLPEYPQAGFYGRYLMKGGPFVGGRIWREPHIDLDTGEPDGMDVLRCEVGGRARDPFAEWTRLAMKPIPKSEFEYMTAAAKHAKVWKPDSPAANPTKPIKLSEQPVSRNPRPVSRRTSRS